MNCAMIILNYNDSQRAWKLASRCQEFTSIDKVIIVDNKSDDNSAEYLLNMNCNGTVDVVLSPENNGFASGNNIGAKFAIDKYNPKFILFANTDTIFENDDVEACLKKLTSNRTLGLISMRMKDVKNNEERSSWKFKPFYEYLFSNFWIYRHFNYDKYTYNEFNDGFQYVDIIRGSFMLFKSEALIKANFFDENTFLYYEEDIISYRLRTINYKVGMLTDHFYIHNHVYSGKENYSFINYHLNRSLKYFLVKYYKINKLEEKLLDMAIFWGDIELRIINKLKLRKSNV
ncbi:glycosyltransferase family 2 protein [Streptococcus thermophilus]|uniref:glycosyltransferase n=1 Tax=Streptococcus thermophilus TaxID=1308 RepID=UPI0019D19A84|nr:glycosyltransferase family 2 protein [Streptococcus thermophilus]MBN6047596.1 glycosyltransferase family 2 protein [Streptococcus thermophilus]